MVVLVLGAYVFYRFPFCKLLIASMVCGIEVNNFETQGRSSCALFWLGIDIVFLFYVMNLIASFAIIMFIVGFGILSILMLAK